MAAFFWARNPQSPVRIRQRLAAKTPRNRGEFSGSAGVRAGSLCTRRLNGGESGIRTHGTFQYTRFPSVRLKPFGHLSGGAPKAHRWESSGTTLLGASLRSRDSCAAPLAKLTGRTHRPCKSDTMRAPVRPPGTAMRSECRVHRQALGVPIAGGPPSMRGAERSPTSAKVPRGGPTGPGGGHSADTSRRWPPRGPSTASARAPPARCRGLPPECAPGTGWCRLAFREQARRAPARGAVRVPVPGEFRMRPLYRTMHSVPAPAPPASQPPAIPLTFMPRGGVAGVLRHAGRVPLRR